MVTSIQMLMNMENELYGGYGLSTNAPSMYNNYTGRMYDDTNSVFANYYNPSFMGSGYGYTNYANALNTSGVNGGQTGLNSTIFAGLDLKDIKNLQNCYAKDLEPSESLLGATVGALAFAPILKPRIAAHPISSVSACKGVKDLFSSVSTEGSTLNKMWFDAEKNGIVRDAYGTMHKAVQNSKGKGGKLFGIVHSKFTPEELAKANELMKKAIQGGEAEIAEATAIIDNAYSKTNRIKNLWNKLRGNEVQTVMQALEETSATSDVIKSAAEKIASGSPKSYLKTLTAGGGVKGGLGMALFEMFFSIGKIKTAFSKDSSTGMKQLGQSTFKAAGNAAGWMLGEALGTWGFTKICASLGTAIAPGVGTAIGAVVGLVGGTLGMWLTGKITKKIVGEDVANKVEAEKLAQTQEGQIQLLENAIQQVQSGRADAATTQTVQKFISAYA